MVQRKCHRKTENEACSPVGGLGLGAGKTSERHAEGGGAGIKGSSGRSPEPRPQRPVWPTLLEENLDGNHSPGFSRLQSSGMRPGKTPARQHRSAPQFFLLPPHGGCLPGAAQGFLQFKSPLQCPCLGVYGWSPRPRGPLSPPHLPIPPLPPHFMASKDTTCHGFRATETKAHHPKRHAEPQSGRGSLEVTHPD